VGSIVSFEKVTVDFDGFLAVNGLDFTLQEGELRFVIGPNGAGKTTMLDVLTGRTRATSGHVRVRGIDVTRMSEHRIARLGIGRKFQTPAVFSTMTVWENVEVAALAKLPLGSLFRIAPSTARTIDLRIDAALERVGLRDRSTERAGRLAHGEKQWLEIAMLLVQDPKVLLLDEPVAGMTRAERLRTGQLIQDLTATHTIIVVEHDMEFVREFASLVTVLHQGQVLREGVMADIQADARVREVYLGRGFEERVA
jgi:urea transport system ATP-binding protein